MRKLIVLFTLVIALTVVGLVSAQPTNFRTHLTGAEEVPPVDTMGQGQAVLQFNSDVSSMSFRLNVANLSSDVTGAHIHCADAGVNGPVGVDLLANAAGNGSSYSGTITEVPANDCGWLTLTDVMNAIVAGGAYVNVHTSEYPAGEIRGQID